MAGTFGHYTLGALKYLTNIGKVAYMVPWVFMANAFYLVQDHLIKNKSPIGLYKKFKEDYFTNIKKAFKSSALINIASALFLPQQYMVAAVALATYVFRRFVVGAKGEEETDKRSYFAAGATAIGKLFKNTMNGVNEIGYAIGNSLRKPVYTRNKA